MALVIQELLYIRLSKSGYKEVSAWGLSYACCQYSLLPEM